MEKTPAREAQIGRYALMKEIGRGGMADVWLGKAVGPGGFEKIVAIKRLTLDKSDKEEYQIALTDEARVQVCLKHPNIVDIYDLNFEAEHPYLVMEYVEGTELRDVLKALRRKGLRMPFSLVASVIHGVSQALIHAHERKDPKTGQPLQIVHRDISPSNILLSSEGDVKLSDFGIAKSTLQSGQTQVGQIKGKFRYMSPEQAGGRLVDYRSDIFSLGLVFYECLFGPAYDDPREIKIFQMARVGQVKLPNGLDPGLEAIFRKLLARLPEERYSSLNDFCLDLDRHVSQKGGIGSRRELKEFLATLDLPKMQEAITLRKEAEDWKPLPTSRLMDATGKIFTLPLENRSRKKKLPLVIGLVLGGALFFFVGQSLIRHRSIKPPLFSRGALGSLEIETDPPDVLIAARYGKTSISKPSPLTLSELPLGQPIALDFSKKGYQTVSRNVTLSSERPHEVLRIPLEEIPMTAVFDATPFAEVSVAGQFTRMETPFKRTLPVDNYEVVFAHPPSGHRVMTRLEGKPGVSFTCSADMAVGDPSRRAKAFCKIR